MVIRAFTSSQLDDQVNGRVVEDDAPQGLRQEFIDAAFHILGSAPFFGDRRLYDIVAQSLGVAPSGQPHAGFRHATGRDLSKADWQRVYDVICRLWPEVPWDLQAEYRAAVNRILAAYRIAWTWGKTANCIACCRPLPEVKLRQRSAN